MTLITRFQGIKDSLQRLPKDFGIGTYQKDLIVRRFVRLPEGVSVQELMIEPTPKIYNVPERLFNLPLAGGTITLSAEDIIVENISRSYIQSTFVDGDVDYFMLEGEKYRLVHISDAKSLGWKLILQRFHDQEE
jgi:hypothetical protein